MGTLKKKPTKVKRKVRKFMEPKVSVADEVIDGLLTKEEPGDDFEYRKMLKDTLIEVTREFLSEHAKTITERAQSRIEMKQKLLGRV